MKKQRRMQLLQLMISLKQRLINATQVAPQDRLSDHVYQYDKDTHEVYRADKAQEHNLSKNKDKDKERPSLREKLNQKKIEVKEMEKNSPKKEVTKNRENSL